MTIVDQEIVGSLPITKCELTYIKNTLEDMLEWVGASEIPLSEYEALEAHYKESLNIITKILEFKEEELERS